MPNGAQMCPGPRASSNFRKFCRAEVEISQSEATALATTILREDPTEEPRKHGQNTKEIDGRSRAHHDHPSFWMVLDVFSW